MQFKALRREKLKCKKLDQDYWLGAQFIDNNLTINRYLQYYYRKYRYYSNQRLLYISRRRGWLIETNNS